MGLRHPTPRRHRPKAFHTPLADTDIPIIAINRRVAVAGHQAQLFAERRRAAIFNHDLAVFIRRARVAQPRALPDLRHA